MLYLSTLEEAQTVIKALSAPMRMEIMKIIYKTPGVSMNYLARTLKLTNSAVSMHVSKLCEAGLVAIQTSSGKRGTMKLVSPCHDRIVIDMIPERESEPRHIYVDDIKIGYFTSCSVSPTFGVSTSDTVSVLVCGM